MSAAKYQLELTEPAEADFRDILLFTLQAWGQEQLAVYGAKIDSALKAITENPQIGIKKYGAMLYPAGQHKIFYRAEKQTIYVLRILHERMDVGKHLG